MSDIIIINNVGIYFQRYEIEKNLKKILRKAINNVSRTVVFTVGIFRNNATNRFPSFS